MLFALLACDFTVMKTVPVPVETCNPVPFLINVTDAKHLAHILLRVRYDVVS